MYFFLAVGFPLAGAFGLLVHPGGAWQRAVGVLLIVLVMTEMVLFARWLRRPLAPDALARRERDPRSTASAEDPGSIEMVSLHAGMKCPRLGDIW